MDKFGDGIKKILLAGIGAVAITGEKSQKVIDDLVKKGELTVEQGKALNKELKHNMKQKYDEARENVKNKAADRKAAADADAKDVLDMIKDMSEDQIASLKALLEKIREDSGVKTGETKDAADGGDAEEVTGTAEEIKEEAAEEADKTEDDKPEE